MTNHELTIPLRDGKTAYARLAGDWSKPLIVFVHGLTGSMDEILPYEAAKYFTKHDYGFLAFNLYDWREGSRHLANCTLAVHARDLDDVVAYAREQGAPTIHVVGHSYGGLTALLSSAQGFNSAILLDPAHPAVPPFDDVIYLKEIDGYLARGSIDHVFSRVFVEENRNLKTEEIISQYHLPTLVVSAGDGILVDAGADYVDRLKDRVLARQSVIAGADHCFTAEAAREQAFAEMLSWLQSAKELD
ncbi:MAG TPA: alpha/beta fold hydrolase [Candidatus Saccharimonadia bacterium]|nr:alpha/beta fold hydrolase [Candidatus Saccharimonadia bacterium]